MNTDFRISVGLFTHPKFIKLTRRLGDSGGLSFLRLLSFTAQNHPDGKLAGMDAEEIAIAGQYSGDAEAFVATLLELRLLDETEGGDACCIHDWQEHNPWAAGAPTRSENARRAANARWGNTSGNGSDSDSTAPPSSPQTDPHPSAMRSASPRNTPLLTYPNLALPIPTSLTSQPAQAPAHEAPDTDTATQATGGQAAGGESIPNGLVSLKNPYPEGWEDCETWQPDVLLARFQNDFADKAFELTSALASASGPVKSQPAFLRPVVLRVLRNEQPALLTPTAGRPASSFRQPMPTDLELSVQRRYLDGIPPDLWPDLEKRARAIYPRVKISYETACQEMRKLWWAELKQTSKLKEPSVASQAP